MLMACAVALAACGEREQLLPGERLDPRVAAGVAEAEGAGPAAVAFRAPRPVEMTAWTHRNGSAAHRAAHARVDYPLDALWAVTIGQGNDRRHRITADPVSDGTRIFTLDAYATVTAVDTAGHVIWSRDLTPAFERARDGSGGGLAVAGGRLFATTGFGDLVALEAATGAEIWRQRLDAPATSPAVAGNIVYAVSRDGHGWALRVRDGRVLWEIPGTPGDAGRAGAAGPAISGRHVIFPFSSGDVMAALRNTGIRVWTTTVAGRRLGVPYAAFTDITADPVVDGGRIYVGNFGGRLAALAAKDGERLWSAGDGVQSPVWPAGGSIFYLTDQNELVRRIAATGAEVWRQRLPLYVRPKVTKRKRVFADYGPVLAGGQLLVATSEGLLRRFDPADGRPIGARPIGAPAASAPIVVRGVVYLLTEDGKLRAFR
ncbi:MAG: quinoprotein [Alphaproteobacteria bacterium]|nr:MAG: quinoprotein [Alphaproteobacteria bacterium]